MKSHLVNLVAPASVIGTIIFACGCSTLRTDSIGDTQSHLPDCNFPESLARKTPDDVFWQHLHVLLLRDGRFLILSRNAVANSQSESSEWQENEWNHASKPLAQLSDEIRRPDLSDATYMVVCSDGANGAPLDEAEHVLRVNRREYITWPCKMLYVLDPPTTRDAR